MGSQYLEANNDSSETFAVKFEFKLEMLKIFPCIRFWKSGTVVGN